MKHKQVIAISVLFITAFLFQSLAVAQLDCLRQKAFGDREIQRAKITSIVDQIRRPVNVALYRNEALFITGIPARYQRQVLEELIKPSPDVVFIDLRQWIEEYKALGEDRQYDRLMEIQKLLLRDEKILAIYGYENNPVLLDFVGCLRSSYNMGVGSKKHRVIILGEEAVDSKPYGVGFLGNSPFYNYPSYIHLTDEGVTTYSPGSLRLKQPRPSAYKFPLAEI